MRTYLLILTASLLATACQNNESSKPPRKTATDTSLTSPAIRSTHPAETQSSLQEFPVFWKAFRTAVLKADTAQIIEMISFPFQTRGPLDDDPVIEYQKTTFIRVFDAYLDQWNGEDLKGTTERQGIMKTETPPKTAVAADYVRVGDLLFNKTSQGWKLSFAYLNNETIDSLNNEALKEKVPEKN